MSLDLERDADGNLAMSLVCDNLNCGRMLICSSNGIILMPPAGHTEEHPWAFYTVCSPACADFMVKDMEKFDWVRVPLAPAFARLFASGRWLPNGFDGAAYVAVVDEQIAKSEAHRQ